MQDHGDLTAADRAVKYLLDRIQRDPDLRYLMLGTQAFALLCEAEAHRLTSNGEAVREAREVPVDHPDAKRKPRLPKAEQLVEEMAVALSEVINWEGHRIDPRILERVKAAHEMSKS